MSMSEAEYDEQLKQYIKDQINANRLHPYRNDKMEDFYDGADTALQELAAAFMIDLYG